MGKLKQKRYWAILGIVVLVLGMIALVSFGNVDKYKGLVKVKKVSSSYKVLSANISNITEENPSTAKGYDEVDYTINYMLDEIEGVSTRDVVINAKLSNDESRYAKFKNISDDNIDVSLSDDRSEINIIAHDVTLGVNNSITLKLLIENAPNGFSINPVIKVKEATEEEITTVPTSVVTVSTNSITGTVYDTNKMNVGNIELGLYKNKTEIKRTYTNENGQYVFSDIENGTYKIRVAEENYAETKSNEFVLNNQAEYDIVVKQVEPFDIETKKMISKAKLNINGKETEYDYPNLDKVSQTVKNAKEISGEIYYTITVKNIGEKNGTVSTVKDIIPDGMSFNKDKNSGWVESDGILYYRPIEGVSIKSLETRQIGLVLDINKTNEAKTYLNSLTTIAEKYEKVIFVLNGSKYSEFQVLEGEKIDELVINDDRFSGWYTDSNYSNRYNFNLEVHKDLILYGRIVEEPVIPEINYYSVTFMHNGEIFEQQTVEEGHKATETENVPEKVHNIFVGWKEEDASEYFDFNTLINRNIVLYSNFEEVLKPVITHTPTDWTNQNVTVTITPNSNLTNTSGYSYKYRVNDGQFVNYTGPFEIEENCDIYAVAIKNNVYSEEEKHEIRNIDKIKPRITSLESTAVDLTSITVAFSGFDNESGLKKYSLYLDNELVTTLSYDSNYNDPKNDTYTFSNLTPGEEYSIKLIATDVATNNSDTEEITVRTDQIIVCQIIERGNMPLDEEDYEPFPTLRQAIDSCGYNQCTIQMLENVDETNDVLNGQDITLDLNGKTVSSNQNYTIKNSGLFTLVDDAENRGVLQNNSNVAILNESTGLLTVGRNDNDISTTIPYIDGETAGVRSLNGTFNFYDGIIKGITAIDGVVDDTPFQHNATVETVDGKQSATLARLTDAEARIKGTYYTRLVKAVDESKKGTKDETVSESVSLIDSFQNNSEYGFDHVDGTLVSKNTEVGTTAITTTILDLTNYDYDQSIIFGGKTDVENRHEESPLSYNYVYGYQRLIISTEKDYLLDENAKILELSYYSSEYQEKIESLEKGKKYYLTIEFDNEGENNHFTVSKVLLEQKNVQAINGTNYSLTSLGYKYGFEYDSESRTFRSTNNFDASIAYSYIEVDLRNSNVDKEFITSISLSTLTTSSYGYVKILKNTQPSIDQYNNYYSSNFYINKYSSSTSDYFIGPLTYSKVLEKGNLYYIQYYYYNSQYGNGYDAQYETAGIKNEMIINSIDIVDYSETTYNLSESLHTPDGENAWTGTSEIKPSVSNGELSHSYVEIDLTGQTDDYAALLKTYSPGSSNSTFYIAATETPDLPSVNDSCINYYNQYASYETSEETSEYCNLIPGKKNYLHFVGSATNQSIRKLTVRKMKSYDIDDLEKTTGSKFKRESYYNSKPSVALESTSNQLNDSAIRIDLRNVSSDQILDITLISPQDSVSYNYFYVSSGKNYASFDEVMSDRSNLLFNVYNSYMYPNGNSNSYYYHKLSRRLLKGNLYYLHIGTKYLGSSSNKIHLQAITTHPAENNSIKVGKISSLVTSNEIVSTTEEITTDYIIQKEGNSDNLRFVGSNPKNFVSFNNELWRIIGVFDTEDRDGNVDRRLKIVRNENVESTNYDASSSDVNQGYGINEWSQAAIMKLINPGYEENVGPIVSNSGPTTGLVNNSLYWNRTTGSCYSGGPATKTCDFTNTGLSSDARTFIDEVKWYTGSVNSNISNLTPAEFYSLERGSATGKDNITVSDYPTLDNVERKTTWIGKVGLPYISDYLYAAGDYYYNGSLAMTRSNCLSGTSYGACVSTNDWLYWNQMPIYTMTPSNGDGSSSSKSPTYALAFTGSPYLTTTNSPFNVRPAVYLSPKTEIYDGNGTSTSPYQIRLSNTKNSDENYGIIPPEEDEGENIIDDTDIETEDYTSLKKIDTSKGFVYDDETGYLHSTNDGPGTMSVGSIEIDLTNAPVSKELKLSYYMEGTSRGFIFISDHLRQEDVIGSSYRYYSEDTRKKSDSSISNTTLSEDTISLTSGKKWYIYFGNLNRSESSIGTFYVKYEMNMAEPTDVADIYRYSYVLNEDVDTIQLLKDIALDDALEIEEERSVILDLNGHGLSTSEGETIYNKGDLTVIDSSNENELVNIDTYYEEKIQQYNEYKNMIDLENEEDCIEGKELDENYVCKTFSDTKTIEPNSTNMTYNTEVDNGSINSDPSSQKLGVNIVNPDTTSALIYNEQIDNSYGLTYHLSTDVSIYPKNLDSDVGSVIVGISPTTNVIDDFIIKKKYNNITELIEDSIDLKFEDTGKYYFKILLKRNDMVDDNELYVNINDITISFKVDSKNTLTSNISYGTINSTSNTTIKNAKDAVLYLKSGLVSSGDIVNSGTLLVGKYFTAQGIKNYGGIISEYSGTSLFIDENKGSNQNGSLSGTTNGSGGTTTTFTTNSENEIEISNLNILNGGFTSTAPNLVKISHINSTGPIDIKSNVFSSVDGLTVNGAMAKFESRDDLNIANSFIKNTEDALYLRIIDKGVTFEGVVLDSDAYAINDYYGEVVLDSSQDITFRGGLKNNSKMTINLPNTMVSTVSNDLPDIENSGRLTILSCETSYINNKYGGTLTASNVIVDKVDSDYGTLNFDNVEVNDSINGKYTGMTIKNSLIHNNILNDIASEDQYSVTGGEMNLENTTVEGNVTTSTGGGLKSKNSDINTLISYARSTRRYSMNRYTYYYHNPTININGGNIGSIRCNNSSSSYNNTTMTIVAGNIGNITGSNLILTFGVDDGIVTKEGLTAGRYTASGTLNFYDGEFVNNESNASPLGHDPAIVASGYEVYLDKTDSTARAYLKSGLPIARIGNQDYSTINDAIGAVPENNEEPIQIDIIRSAVIYDDFSIPNNKKVKLNLSEYVLTLNECNCTNNGELTVIGDETGKITGNSNLTNNGLFTMNSGEWSSDITNNSSVVVNDGVIKRITNYSIDSNENYSSIVIHGGEVKSITNNYAKYGDSFSTYSMTDRANSLVNMDGGKANIYNGKYGRVVIDNSEEKTTIENDGGSVVINDGTIYEVKNLNKSNLCGTVDVYGGDLISSRTSVIENDCTMNISNATVSGYDNTIRNFGTLTISNSELTNTINTDSSSTIVSTGVLTLNGTNTITCNRTRSKCYGITIHEGTVTINDNTTINSDYGINFNSSSGGDILTINNVTINADRVGIINENDSISGKINIKAGSINGGTYGIYDTGTTTITIGTKDSDVSTTNPSIYGDTGAIYSNGHYVKFYDGVLKTKSSGKTYNDVSIFNDIYNEGGYSLYNEDFTEDDINKKKTYLTISAEARIGDVEYNSLLDAIGACQEGETIYLLKDIYNTGNTVTIDTNKSVIIDGQDYSITGIKFVINGNLEMNNLGDITYKSNAVHNYLFTVNNGGTFTANDINKIDGEINNSGTLSLESIDGIASIDNKTNSNMEIISSNVGNIVNSGQATITSVTFTGGITNNNSQASANLTSCTLKGSSSSNSYGEMTLIDTKIEGTLTNANTNNYNAVLTIGGNSSIGSIVNHGTVTSTTSGTVGTITNNNLYTHSTGSITTLKNHGRFTYNSGSISSLDNYDRFYYNGGTITSYKGDITTIASGKKIKYSNNKYSLDTLDAAFENKRTSKKYTSLTTAFNEAENDDIIKIIRDIYSSGSDSYTNNNTTKNITLDLNGFTYKMAHNNSINNKGLLKIVDNSNLKSGKLIGNELYKDISYNIGYNIVNSKNLEIDRINTSYIYFDNKNELSFSGGTYNTSRISNSNNGIINVSNASFTKHGEDHDGNNNLLFINNSGSTININNSTVKQATNLTNSNGIFNIDGSNVTGKITSGGTGTIKDSTIGGLTLSGNMTIENVVLNGAVVSSSTLNITGDVSGSSISSTGSTSIINVNDNADVKTSISGNIAMNGGLISGTINNSNITVNTGTISGTVNTSTITISNDSSLNLTGSTSTSTITMTGGSLTGDVEAKNLNLSGGIINGSVKISDESNITGGKISYTGSSEDYALVTPDSEITNLVIESNTGGIHGNVTLTDINIISKTIGVNGTNVNVVSGSINSDNIGIRANEAIVGAIGGEVSITTPNIIGKVKGIDNDTNLYFYDGVIGGATPNSGSLMRVEPGYTLQRSTDNVNNIDLISLREIWDVEKVAVVNNINFDSLQSAINACGTSEVCNVSIFVNIELNEPLNVSEGKNVFVYLNSFRITPSDYVTNHTGSGSITLKEGSIESNLSGRLYKFLANAVGVSTGENNVLIYEMEDGSKLSSTVKYTLYKDEENVWKTVKMKKEDEIGNYTVGNKTEEMRTTKGRIYINSLESGNYKLVGSDKKEITFRINNDGTLLGNVRVHVKNESTRLVSTAVAEYIISIQTGILRVNYLLIMAIILLIILLIIIFKKRSISFKK